MTAEEVFGYIPHITALIAAIISIGAYLQTRRKQLHDENTTAFEAWQEYGSTMKGDMETMRIEIDELQAIVESQRMRIKILEQYVHGAILLDSQIRAKGDTPVWDYRQVEKKENSDA
jgi:hypothetical protein